MVKALLSTFIVWTLIVCSFAAQYASNNEQISITSEKDLSDIILAHLGQNTGQMSQNLKQYMIKNKLSILNAVEEVALVLVSDVDTKKQLPKRNFDISGKFIESLGKNLQKITTHFLIGKSDAEIDNYIAQNMNNIKHHKLIVYPEEVEQIKKLLTYKATQKRRVLEQNLLQQTTESSYIIRFFFTLIFIIVIIGSLSAIACMDNRKDTLLYAKFIADVGR